MTDQRRKNKFLIVLDIFVNVAGMALIFTVIWFLFYRYNLSEFLYKKGTAVLIFVYSIQFFLFASLYGGHNVEYYRTSEIIYSQCLSMAFVNIVTWLQICLIDRKIVALWPIVLLSVIDALFILWWSVWSIRRFRKRNIPRALTLLYSGSRPPYELEEKLSHYKYKFEVKNHINTSCGYDRIVEMLDDNDGVLMGEIDPELKSKIIKYCFERKMPVCIMPNVSEIVLRSAYVISLLDRPMLICKKGELSLLDEFIKRCFDIFASGVGLVVAAPFMLIIALAIKVYDKGPVLYKQTRLTINGSTFELYKFRSMIVDAEGDGVARLAKENDDRITPVGKFIRRFRLDELPQLINILKGEMSIVGPRAERPEIAEQYEKDIPEFKYRLKVKAGLTGYAQVLGRYNTSPYDKLMWDLMYIEGYSLFMDLKIIMMTIKILFIPESTSGVGENYITAQKSYEFEETGERIG
ncbi:MAG: sugar transferase [Lachnospiraceae bacterium]|nr:sugar transferase [Lachnospiraceae bacterium]